MACDIYNQQYWYSNYHRKHYAPALPLYRYMVTPMEETTDETRAYADLSQHMRIFCEYKWLTYYDEGKGYEIGPFEDYEQGIAFVLTNPKHIQNWKDKTRHPGDRTYWAPPNSAPSQGRVTLINLAHQASNTSTQSPRDQKPIAPKAMPKDTPNPPKPPAPPTRRTSNAKRT